MYKSIWYKKNVNFENFSQIKHNSTVIPHLQFQSSFIYFTVFELAC